MCRQSAQHAFMTATEQKEFLEDVVRTTLDNFSMARCLVSFLIAYKKANLPFPGATIQLSGNGPSATIPGTNCGFFVIPVIHMAILDCRRSLEFFGLNCNYTTNRLMPFKGRRSDDLGIEHFGLDRVTPSLFIEATSSVIPEEVEPIAVQVHKYGSKRLAHSTMSESTVMLPAIRDISSVLIEAHMRFLFDALSLPRPSINPSDT
jgi:hypothetical protein